MKLVSYDHGQGLRAGLAIGDAIIDLEKGARALAKGKLPASVKELLEAGEPAMTRARKTSAQAEKLLGRIEAGKERRPAWIFPEDCVHLGPPVPNPEKIICLGLNYLDHVREQEGRLHKTIEPPDSPVIFSKFASSLTGPYDPIAMPPTRVTEKVDYEVELALVIGRTAKAVSQKEATACIAGYMVLNDVSARDCQFQDKQWVRAKSFDSFAPCGPWLVSADEIANPHKLRLWCVVNGETMQESSTKNMIFKIPMIVSFLSQAITLKPGDIISTGTPAGVGAFRETPVFLKSGDVVECGIEGIGTICNTCERGK